MEAALVGADGDFVDAGFAAAHEAFVGELPQFVAVGAVPVVGVVVVFVLKPDGAAIFAATPELFDQAILQLAFPLAIEEGLNGVAAHDVLAPVAPLAVGGVGEADTHGVARVPGVFGHAGFLPRCVEGEGGADDDGGWRGQGVLRWGRLG